MGQMIANLVLLGAGCVLLFVGADRLVRGAVVVGHQLNLSPTVSGLILVAIGTSLPELAVSLDAAFHGHGAMAAGNVVGSNIVNITLVLGAGAALGTLPANIGTRHVDLPFLTALTLAACWLISDGQVTRLEGLALISAVVIAFIWRALRTRADHNPPEQTRSSDLKYPTVSMAMGIIALIAGAEAMVTAALSIAMAFGLSESTIALTVTALGTGIPEIAATVAAVLSGQKQLALGSVVGTNIVNMGGVLGLSAVMTPLTTSEISSLPLFALPMLTLALWLMTARNSCVSRISGVTLLTSFGAYQILLLS